MRMRNVIASGWAVVALVACAETNQRSVPTQPSQHMSDAAQIESILRAGQEIERAQNAPFDQAQFNKKLAVARRPFDSCVQNQIDHKLISMNSPALTPAQKANGLVEECRPALQPVYDLIYMSPLAKKPTEARKVVDQVWSEGRQRIIGAI